MRFIAFSLLLRCQTLDLYRPSTLQYWKVTVAFSAAPCATVGLGYAVRQGCIINVSNEYVSYESCIARAF